MWALTSSITMCSSAMRPRAGIQWREEPSSLPEIGGIATDPQ
jgi:hypothetical protein